MQRVMRKGRFGSGRVAAWFDNDLRIVAVVVVVAVVAVAVVVVAVVAVVAVLGLVATAILYTKPPGRRSIAFETTDVSAISVGQDVRVAGVSVGKVSDLELLDTSVRVTAEVEDDLEVGTDTRAEVRMLTPVGGYAVTLVPLGETPLGDAALPSGQVTVPYSIGDVLQAAPNVTDKVDGERIDANLVQVAEALNNNPGSVESVISGMTAVARAMDHQRAGPHGREPRLRVPHHLHREPRDGVRPDP